MQKREKTRKVENAKNVKNVECGMWKRGMWNVETRKHGMWNVETRKRGMENVETRKHGMWNVETRKLLRILFTVCRPLMTQNSFRISERVCFVPS